VAHRISGARKWKNGENGVKGREGTRTRSGEEKSVPSIWRGRVAEIEGSRELGSSQDKGPSIGYSKSQRREEREEDNCWIWIVGGRWICTWDRVSMSREKRLESLGTGIARLREAIPRSVRPAVRTVEEEDSAVVGASCQRSGGSRGSTYRESFGLVPFDIANPIAPTEVR
jgi:hypothetical protein